MLHDVRFRRRDASRLARAASYGSGAKPYTAGCVDYTPRMDQIANRAAGARLWPGMTVAAIHRIHERARAASSRSSNQTSEGVGSS